MGNNKIVRDFVSNFVNRELLFFTYSNIDRIREGIGDKLGLLVRGTAMFFTALTISFIYQWRIALIMFPITPISCFMMAQLAQVSGKFQFYKFFSIKCSNK